MELQPFGNPPGLRCRERFVQRCHAVSVQVVQDDPDHLDLRIGLVHQPSHLLGKVLHRAQLGHLHVPPPGLRLAGREQVACALAPILVVLPQRNSGLNVQVEFNPEAVSTVVNVCVASPGTDVNDLALMVPCGGQ